MDLGAIAQWVAISGAALGGTYAVIRGAILVVLWVQRRNDDSAAWSAQDKRLGQLTDRTQVTISSLEMSLERHTEQDAQRFKEFGDQLTQISRAIGRIEGMMNGHYKDN